MYKVRYKYSKFKEDEKTSRKLLMDQWLLWFREKKKKKIIQKSYQGKNGDTKVLHSKDFHTKKNKIK